MTIYLPEVRKVSMDYVNLPVFNPNVFSEDEDDLPGVLTQDPSLSKGVGGALSGVWQGGELLPHNFLGSFSGRI